MELNDPSLGECTNTLLRNPDKVQDWLTLADKYMQTFTQNPNMFLLPKAHEFMKPLLQAYAEDLEGFTHYIIGLRDSFDRGSAQFDQIQSIYRRVNGRYVQQQRRQRMQRAVDKAEELWGEITFQDRMVWIAKLEHEWAQRRLAFLEKRRDRLRNQRLSTEERAEALLEFWDMVDTEIHQGDLPPWQNSPNLGATPL